MTILAQHGHGLGSGNDNKVWHGLDATSINGVIMSPLNLIPSSTKNHLAKIAENHPSSVRLVDPQNYVQLFDNPKIEKLGRYPHFGWMSEDSVFDPSRRRNLVEKTLEWQSELAVSAFMSPTVFVTEFGSQYDEVAFRLAEESINQRTSQRPLLINLLVSEYALFDHRAMEEWLDDLVELEVDGFYLVIERHATDYSQRFDHVNQLIGLMRICHKLSSFGHYVLVGYCDIATLLLHAVGVDGTATGWWHNLRQFSRGRFVADDEIRRMPNPRYTSRTVTSLNLV